jgi:hypothetical protein
MELLISAHLQYPNDHKMILSKLVFSKFFFIDDCMGLYHLKKRKKKTS